MGDRVEPDSSGVNPAAAPAEVEELHIAEENMQRERGIAAQPDELIEDVDTLAFDVEIEEAEANRDIRELMARRNQLLDLLGGEPRNIEPRRAEPSFREEDLARPGTPYVSQNPSEPEIGGSPPGEEEENNAAGPLVGAAGVDDLDDPDAEVVEEPLHGEDDHIAFLAGAAIIDHQVFLAPQAEEVPRDREDENIVFVAGGALIDYQIYVAHQVAGRLRRNQARNAENGAILAHAAVIDHHIYLAPQIGGRRPERGGNNNGLFAGAVLFDHQAPEVGVLRFLESRGHPVIPPMSSPFANLLRGRQRPSTLILEVSARNFAQGHRGGGDSVRHACCFEEKSLVLMRNGIMLLFLRGARVNVYNVVATADLRNIFSTRELVLLWRGNNTVICYYWTDSSIIQIYTLSFDSLYPKYELGERFPQDFHLNGRLAGAIHNGYVGVWSFDLHNLLYKIRLREANFVFVLEDIIYAYTAAQGELTGYDTHGIELLPLKVRRHLERFPGDVSGSNKNCHLIRFQGYHYVRAKERPSGVGIIQIKALSSTLHSELPWVVYSTAREVKLLNAAENTILWKTSGNNQCVLNFDSERLLLSGNLSCVKIIIWATGRLLVSLPTQGRVLACTPTYLIVNPP